MKWWKSPFARRQPGWLLAALPAGAVTGSVLGPALAAPPARIETRVELYGVGAIAAHLRRAIPQRLAEAMASHPLDPPPGTRLVIRVTDLFLSNDNGADPDGSIMMDALDGEALLLDARGRVLRRQNIAARATPEFGLLNAAREPQRVDSLAQSLAYWMVRQMGD